MVPIVVSVEKSNSLINFIKQTFPLIIKFKLFSNMSSFISDFIKFMKISSFLNKILSKFILLKKSKNSNT